MSDGSSPRGEMLALAQVEDAARFGGKAASLGRAVRAGLRVPLGMALSTQRVEAIVCDEPGAVASCSGLFARLGAALAVRSSSVDEDGVSSSFAGQHESVLNVTTPAGVRSAIARVYASAHAPSALAYRQRLGLAERPSIALLVQRMVAATCAGVMFTRNPLDGRNERVIEAAWGLGEAVVSGLVEPDRAHLAPGGEVLDYVVADKDLAVEPSRDGGTAHRTVDGARRTARCLGPAQLARLDALADACDAVYGALGGHDVEWAFALDEVGVERLYLLQRRPITRVGHALEGST